MIHEFNLPLATALRNGHATACAAGTPTIVEDRGTGAKSISRKDDAILHRIETRARTNLSAASQLVLSF
jgi:hypothetical protein